jgi:hypothetical protein
MNRTTGVLRNNATLGIGVYWHNITITSETYSVSRLWYVNVSEEFVPPDNVATNSPISDILMKSGLATLVAIFIMVIMGYPAYKFREDWEISDWIKWMVISLIILLFGIIIIQNIFAI